MTTPKKPNTKKRGGKKRDFAQAVKLNGSLFREAALQAAQANRFLTQLIDGIANPDDLVGRKGLSVYEEMRRRDAAVRSGLALMKLARLSVGYQVQSPKGWEKNDSRMPKMIDSINYMIEQIKGDWYDALRQMYVGVDYGFSVTEKLYTRFESGPFRGMIGISKIKTKSTKDFRFNLDEFGNVKPLGILQINGDGMIDRRLDPSKFMVFTFMGEESNIYGESILRPCYRNYKSKDMIYRFWNIALERFGMPTPFATIEEKSDWGEDEVGLDGLSDAEIAVINTVLKNLQAGVGGVLPPNVKVDVLKNLQGTIAYEPAIKTHDREIMKALLIPSLMLGEGDRSGSRALGQTHSETFLFLLNYLGRIMEELLNEQLIRPLIDMNFPNAQAYPIYKFDDFSDDRKRGFSEIVDIALRNGVVDPDEPFIRERMGMPPKEDQEREEKEDPKKTVITKPEPVEKPKATEEPVSPVEKQDEKAKKASKDFDIRAFLHEHVIPYYSGISGPGDWPSHGGLSGYVDVLEFAQPKAVGDLVRATPNRPLKPFEKKVDFRKTAQMWKDLYAKTVEKTTAAMEDLYQAARPKLKRVVESGSRVELDKFALPAGPLGKFREAYQELYVVEFVEGARDAITEVEGAVGETIKPFNFDLARMTERLYAMTPDQAIDYLMRKVPTLRSKLPIYNRKAFTVTGIEKERILADVKIQIEKGMARGASVKQVMRAIDDVFEKYRASGEIIDGALSRPWRLETIARTNLGEAYNAGRLSAFESPGVAEHMEAYEYASVLDERTTDFCVDYDGFSRPVNDAIWESIWPPNHYNCRSVVVPIVKGDTWERTEKRPEIEPAEGFIFDGGA